MLPLDERLRLAISARQVDATMMSSLRSFTEASLSDTAGRYAAFVFPNDFDNVLLGLCRVPKDILGSLQDKFNVLDDPHISMHRALDGIGQFEMLPLVQGGRPMVNGAEMVLSKAGIGMNLIMDEGKSLVSDIARMGSIIQGTGIITGAGGLGILMMLIKFVMTPSKKSAQVGRHSAPLYFPHFSPGRG